MVFEYDDPMPSLGTHWLGQISDSPEWITDGRLQIDAKALAHCAPSVRAFLESVDHCRNRVDSAKIRAVWDGTEVGEVAHVGDLEHDTHGDLYLRVGGVRYGPAYVAFATFVTKADEYRQGKVSNGPVLVGLRDGVRVFTLMSCRDDPPAATRGKTEARDEG